MSKSCKEKILYKFLNQRQKIFSSQTQINSELIFFITLMVCFSFFV